MDFSRPKRMLAAVALALGATLGVAAQTNVEIRGTVDGGAGKKVLLGAYGDMLTMGEVFLDSAVVAADGTFALRCFADYPRMVFLQMECYSQSFYIEAGRTYDVYVPPFEWDLADRRNVFLDPVALPVEFVGVDSTELNLRIMRYEAVVDSFLDSNRYRVDFRYRPDRRAVAQLDSLVGRRFLGRGIEGDFFERYVAYTTLQRRLALRVGSRAQMARRYVLEQPVRYHDESYMRFFLALYEHAISGGTKRIPQWRMAQWVQEGDAAAWLDTLGLDPLLQNEQVRELAAIEALKEMYYDKRYDRAGVRLTAERLAAASKFAEHRALVERLTASFDSHHAFGRGQRPAPFVLPDVERRPVSLDTLRGRWVYLSFVRVGDPHSLREIETMAHFRDTLARTHPEVSMVTVVCDREFQKMYHFLKNSKRGTRYGWTWLHFDGDYRLLERYGVTSYPTFVLISPEGRLVYDYTPAPASGILLHGPWEKESEKEYGDHRF